MTDDSSKKNKQFELQDVHQYYTSILNCMPYWVYWLDKDCILQGCNTKFSQFLGLKSVNDFSGTPYQKLAQITQWPSTVVDAFRLDDMSVIFSGQAVHDRDLQPILFPDGTLHHFVCNRDPILDNAGRVVGAVVILMEVPERRQAQPEKPQLAEQAAGPKERAPRVLIVEDNIVAKQVEEALLRALHCEVDCADSGQQAMALFQPGHYDLVIMDIGLEDTSGYVLSKKFRQLEKNTNARVPIIALTSFEADLVKYDCDYYFMDGVISKPLTAEQAEQIVQHYIYHQDTVVNGLKYA
ncbi:MAG: response regulator [Legionellales bacterium]|nr:response regulator [Legionellales bacterium]